MIMRPVVIAALVAHGTVTVSDIRWSPDGDR